MTTTMSLRTLPVRLGVIVALGLFATTTITFAASKRIEAAKVAKPEAAAPAGWIRFLPVGSEPADPGARPSAHRPR